MKTPCYNKFSLFKHDKMSASFEWLYLDIGTRDVCSLDGVG